MCVCDASFRVVCGLIVTHGKTEGGGGVITFKSTKIILHAGNTLEVIELRQRGRLCAMSVQFNFMHTQTSE